MPDSAIVYLFGYPASGKLTIAKSLAEMMDMTVVDNHLIDNPIFQLLKVTEDTPIPDEAWEQVDRIRDVVYDVLGKLAPREQSYVLTNVLLDDNQRHKDKFAAARDVAKERGAFFLPVRLLCSQEELLNRVSNHDRKMKLKQRDPEKLKKAIDGREVLKPDHPNLLELDVTKLSAKQAAEKIAKVIKDNIDG